MACSDGGEEGAGEAVGTRTPGEMHDEFVSMDLDWYYKHAATLQ
jgi:hypothetical protein